MKEIWKAGEKDFIIIKGAAPKRTKNIIIIKYVGNY